MELHNLKRMGGSYKGIIGECMFKLTRRNLVVTKFFNRSKYIDIFGHYFRNDQLKFLKDNWFSIEAIEIKVTDGRPLIFLFEIKTRNKYEKDLGYATKMTEFCHDLYSAASELGFVTKVATVWLYENWNYKVDIEDFDSYDYYIDSPKKYDNVKAIT